MSDYHVHSYKSAYAWLELPSLSEEWRYEDIARLDYDDALWVAQQLGRNLATLLRFLAEQEALK